MTLEELKAMESPTISNCIAAAACGADRRTVAKAVKSGVIKSVQLSPRKTLILREPFIALLEGKASGGDINDGI